MNKALVLFEEEFVLPLTTKRTRRARTMRSTANKCSLTHVPERIMKIVRSARAYQAWETRRGSTQGIDSKASGRLRKGHKIG